MTAKAQGEAERQGSPVEPDVVIHQWGAAGIILLNRPRQLNALTLAMVRTMAPALAAFEADPAVTRIIIAGAGGKAFCAGGDIRALHDLGRAGDIAAARQFWREEYTLNLALQRCRKPIVALLDGIVMGGGVGLSFHGSHRVATEKLIFAMPEVGIGFFPDVGASHLLPRIADQLGTYLALTGARIGQGDALALGLATHAVAAASVAELQARLVAGEAVDACLEALKVATPAAPLLEERHVIREAFAGARVIEIVALLGQMALGGSEFAAATLDTMRMKSPTSMAIALRQMRLGQSMTFAEAMQMEFRIVSRIAEGRDFYEGVRAVIIDKDNAPAWTPATIEALDDAAIDAYFAPLADELECA